MNRRLNIGILGCINLHTPRYLDSIMKNPRVRLAGISEQGDAAAVGRQTAETTGVPFFESHDALLDLDDLDAVYLGNLPVDHLDAIDRAGKRGIDVLCDKPLATTLADAKAADDIAEAAGIKLMVSFFPRFQLPLIKLKQHLDSGEAGDVVAIYSVKYGRVPTKAATDLPTSWYLDPNLTGGGGFLDIGIHAMDAIRWLADSEPVTVNATVGNMVNVGLGSEDFGVATYEFANGVVGTLSAGWVNPDHSPTWLDVKFEVLTTKGAFIINKPHHDMAIYTNAAAMRLAWLKPDTDLQIDAFAGMITDDLDPPITAKDGIAALGMGLGAYESSKRDAKVDLGTFIDNG